jgi:leader peptidase (prepilin peptidase)/N-methyltransferase
MDISNAYDIISVFGAFSAFLTGACAGSFINAVAMRTVLEKKWWGSERSVCDSCGETLAARDLVPILSYLALGGRCRYCGQRIGPRHFAAELSSAALTAALFWRWGFSMALVTSLVVLWFSLFNSLTDFDNGYIYDVWAVAPGVAGIVIRLTEGMPAVIDGLLGAALGFCFIAAIILVSRGGMGWGDAMLMLGIGGAVGWRYTAVSLYTGFLVGGVVVLPLLLTKKLTRKDAIPLGPFLAIGSVITLFTGNAITRRLDGFLGFSAGWPWG